MVYKEVQETLSSIAATAKGLVDDGSLRSTDLPEYIFGELLNVSLDVEMNAIFADDVPRFFLYRVGDETAIFDTQNIGFRRTR